MEKSKHMRYIIDDREIELLDRYDGIISQTEDSHRYDTFNAATLADFCRIKDRSNDLFFRRCEAAREVIDLVAGSVGIDPQKCSEWLYAPDYDGGSPLVRRITEWISHAGDKAKLKKRVQELEQENSVLRSLVTGGTK